MSLDADIFIKLMQVIAENTPMKNPTPNNNIYIFPSFLKIGGAYLRQCNMHPLSIISFFVCQIHNPVLQHL